MVTLEQKLNLFKKIVDDKVQQEIDEKMFQKDEEISEFLTKERKLLESNADRTKKVAMDRIKRQKSEALSTLTQAERKEYLRLNEDILNDLVDRVQGKLRSFTQEEGYKTFLESTLTSAMEMFSKEEDVYIYIAPAGYETSKEIIVKTLQKQGYTRYTIKEGELTDIGGFVVENATRTMRINKTFAEALYNKKDTIGQLLHDYIRKGV